MRQLPKCYTPDPIYDDEPGIEKGKSADDYVRLPDGSLRLKDRIEPDNGHGAGVATEAYREVEPMPSIPWPKPLAERAFYGLTGEIVRAIEPNTEGDTAAILMNFLVAFGNAMGRGTYARVEADRHGCNLNVVQAGETSKGISVVWEDPPIAVL